MVCCSVDDCGREVLAKGYCDAHYKRFIRGKPVEAPLRRYDTSEAKVGEPQVTTRVSAATHTLLEREAKRRGVGIYTQAREVLEEWRKRQGEAA